MQMKWKIKIMAKSLAQDPANRLFTHSALALPNADNANRENSTLNAQVNHLVK